MNLISINVGQPKDYQFGDRVIRSAIAKRSIGEDPVEVTALGVPGDAQVDQQHHGGIHQAVYGYFEESYHFWAKELRRDDLSPGMFGENLTIDGMTEDSMCIGDIFSIGDVQLQVSQPRQPCYKLGIVFGHQQFLEQFLASRRLGAYFRVLRVGTISAGMEITKVSDGIGKTSVSDVCRLRFFDKNDLAGAAQCA
ncbi:MAG: MOSC domain-containing protein, partial [Planctomycetales bacterium]|nr:MOSC domain-containing protein [Planctomycetales bacterium]